MNSKIIFFISSIIFVTLKKNNICLRFCFFSFFFLLFFLERDTVKSDCPMQENYEIFKELLQTVGLLY